MKTKHIILSTFVAITVVLACSKTKAPPHNEFNSVNKPNSKSNLKIVSPKNYYINSSQCNEIVNRFKIEAKRENNPAGRLIELDSIALDSANWVIEAALNFDFDVQLEGGYEYWRTDTIEKIISINDDNFKVSSDDIEAAYISFCENLNDSVSSNFKMRFVDLDSYIYEPGTSQAIIRAIVVKYSIVYPVTCPTTGPFLSSQNYKPMNPGMWGNVATNCSPSVSNNLPIAVDKLNIYKNCSSVSHDCPKPHYQAFYYGIVLWQSIIYSLFTNGGTAPATNPFPSELYDSGFNHSRYGNNNWWCNTTNTNISGTQLNTYLMNQISYANTWVAGFTNFEIVERKINTNMTFYNLYYEPACNCWASYPVIWWDMDARIGLFSCAGPID